MMHNLLYGDDAAIDNQVLFRDLDMGDVLQHEQVREIMVDYKILLSNQYIFTNNFCDTLSVCDKLARHDIIDEILASDRIPDVPYASLIINHALSDDALIELYAKTCAYNLLYGNIHYKTCMRVNTINISRHNIFRDATLNGLIVTDISVGDENMNDNHIRCCTSLTALTIYDIDSQITTFAPFAKSLKVLLLYARNYHKFGDKELEMCTSIVELCAFNNHKITTCAPFANSLEVLDASGFCGVGDDGLVLCRFIRKLFMYDNIKITTCEPFAKTLKILHAKGYCGIADIGIASCHNIEVLHAWNNRKITTCKPFAKSLKRLYASYSCGINDNGIASCHILEYLDATGNPTITTCAPFANSLKYLCALYDESGMNTDGIRLCKSLVEIHCAFNNKIDCRKITMAKNNGR